LSLCRTAISTPEVDTVLKGIAPDPAARIAVTLTRVEKLAEEAKQVK